MPSVDFQRMSDHELSDIVVLVQSQAPVDTATSRRGYIRPPYLVM